MERNIYEVLLNHAKEREVFEKYVTFEKADGNSENGEETISLTIVGSTANVIDSHGDMFIPEAYKSLEGSTTYLLESHSREWSKIIADDFLISAEAIKIELGETTALIAKGVITPENNPLMFKMYKNGKVKQHSVSGRATSGYVPCIKDCAWSPDYKSNWDKYYPQVLNKDVADKMGSFYVIKEFELLEISSVLFASNKHTPTLISKCLEDNAHLIKRVEEPEKVQSLWSRIISF